VWSVLTRRLRRRPLFDDDSVAPGETPPAELATEDR
jgi:hypothetical protein